MRKEDIKCIVLKGLALASYYPDFSKREFGDLDCYLIKNENTVANEGDLLAKRLGWNVEEVGYKHSFDLMNEICMTYLGLDIYAKGLTISSHPEMAESMILDVLRKPTVGSGQLTLLQKISNIWNRFKRQYKYRFIETESVRTLMCNTIAFSSYMHRNVKLD